jgi:hypothetical protein
MAAALAERLKREVGDKPASKVQRAFQLCYSREKFADEWPESGPRVVCKRKLDDGYSSIVSTKRLAKDQDERSANGTWAR